MRDSFQKWVLPRVRPLAFLVHPHVLLGAAFVLGGSLIFMNQVFGLRAEDAPEVFSPHWWLLQGEKAGYILAVSGIIGMISRILWATGVFRSAISDIMVGDEFLDIRNDLPALWGKLTQRVYLPDFEPRTPEDQVFLDKVHRAIDNSIRQRHNFYARDVHLHYQIEEIPNNSNYLKITKTITYCLYPYNPNTEIQLLNTTIAADGVELSEYDEKETSFQIKDGDAYRDAPRAEETAGKKKIWIASLSGQECYEVKRVRESLIPFRKDPILHFAAPHVIDRLTFTAACNAPRAMTYFSEVGIEEHFENLLAANPEAAARGDQHRFFRGVLLPEQGFVFVVQVNSGR